MTSPVLRLAIEILVDAAWKEASKQNPKWDGLALRVINQLPENMQHAIYASDDTDFERLFLMVAARKIRGDCRGKLPN